MSALLKSLPRWEGHTYGKAYAELCRALPLVPIETKKHCFNALISNTDDHPRNHAMIAWDRDWHLSPAYDLTPSTPVSLERRDLALVCGDAGRLASAENLLSQCPRFLLDQDKARSIIADMRERVRATWRDLARQVGVTARDCEVMSGAFVYPGF